MGIRSTMASAVRRLADTIGKPSFAGTPFPDGQVANRAQLEQELGGTGTFNFGGFIRGEDFNPQMDAQTAIANLDEMRRSDSQVHAALEVVKQPIRTADYELDPDDPDDPFSNEVAEFVRWNLFEGMVTTWDDVIRQSLLMLDFGFMLFEKVWAVAEDGPYKGRIILHKLAARPPKTIWQWFTDEDGSLISIKQLAVKAGTYQFLDVPSSKLVRFTFQQEGDNFTGISMLRSAYPHWLIKKQLYLIDAIRATRFGVGIPRAKLKAGYRPTEEDRNAIALMLQGLSSHQHAYLIEPEQMAVDILMPQGVQGGAQLLPSINHQNEQITRNILAQFLDMGGKSSGGSRALGASAMDFFLNAIESIADQVCDVLNKQLIKDLVDMNFDVGAYPRLRPVGIQDTDVKSLAAAYASLASAGLMTADRKTENTFRALMNLPEVSEEDVPGNGLVPGQTPSPGQAPQEAGGAAPPAGPGGPRQPPGAPAPQAGHPAKTSAVGGKPAPAKTSVTKPTAAKSAVTEQQPAHTTATAEVPAVKAPNPQRAERMDDDPAPEAGGQPLPEALDVRPAERTQAPATTNVTDVMDAPGAPEASRDVARQPGYTKPAEGVSGRPEEVPAPDSQPTSHDPRGQTLPATSTWTQPAQARTNAYGVVPAQTTVATVQPAVSDIRDVQPAESTVSKVVPATAHMARSTTVPSSGSADEEGHPSSGRTDTAAEPRRSVAASDPARTLRHGTALSSLKSRTASDGILTFWRDPSPLEMKVLELREIPRRLDTARSALLATLRSVREEQILRIASAVAHARPDAPAKAPLVGKMASEIEKVMQGVYDYGHEQVVSELRKQGLRNAAARFADEWEGMSDAQVERSLGGPWNHGPVGDKSGRNEEAHKVEQAVGHRLNYYQGVYYMVRQDAEKVLAVLGKKDASVEKEKRGFTVKSPQGRFGPAGWKMADVPFRIKESPGYLFEHVTPQMVKDADVRSIPLGLLTATQPSLTVTRQLPEGMPTDLPIVVEHDGRLYIHDGHKRLSKARAAGAEQLKVRVVELSESVALAAPKKRHLALPHLQASAQLSAQSASDKLLAQARAEALRLNRAGWDEDEIEDALLVSMGELSDGDIVRIAAMEVNEAFSMGRVAAGEDLKDSIEKAVYSAILDGSVCDTCEALDGQEFDVDSDEYEENMPPNQNCDGGDNCRCSYIYVLKEEGGEE